MEKKIKIKELVITCQAPLVPCCVGCAAVKDKGSAPDVTQVPHVPSLLLEWSSYISAELGQETSPASPCLLHCDSLSPHGSPAPNCAEGLSCSCSHNSSTRDSPSPADFSWALLLSLKTLFCSHHLEPAHTTSCASSNSITISRVRQQHDYSFISLILAAFAFQGATMQ